MFITRHLQRIGDYAFWTPRFSPLLRRAERDTLQQ